MKKNVVLLGAISGLLLFTHLPTAQARDAAVIADSCKARIIVTAQRCRDSILDNADGCINKINQLLASGNIDSAVSLADRTSDHIKRSALRCEKSLIRLRNSCVASLLDMGADDLAQQVRDVANENIDSIKGAKADALAAISNALAGGAP